MDRREKTWRITAYIFGALGAALLVAILVLKLLYFDITLWTLPLAAVVIVFLIADDRARRLKNKRLQEEEPAKKPEPEPEQTLPKDAFEFDQK